MSDETILKIGNIIIPIGAGRGITQTLQPIDNGEVRRTVNGTLIDLTRVENRKFESQISATDMSSPAIAGLWKGSTVDVDCIEQLRQTVDPPSTSVTLIRNAVAGSIIGRDSDENKVAIDTQVNRDITFVDPITFVEFRPVLSMMIVAKSFSRDEYGAEESWTIDLEEV